MEDSVTKQSDVQREDAADPGDWVRCRCGKERQVPIDRRLGEYVMRRLAEMTMCRACEADFSKVENLCPESVRLANGVAACSREWHHDGRCEPFVFGRHLQQGDQ